MKLESTKENFHKKQTRKTYLQNCQKVNQKRT